MRLAVAALLAAGCYNPSYENCKVTCASNNGCPSGLSCDMALGVCRSPDGTCSGNGDGGLDDSVVDAKDLCGWTYASNFDPCSFGTPSDLELTAPKVYNTDSGAAINFPELTAGTVLQQAGGPDIRLLTFNTFHISSGGVLTLTGKMPLIIAANTVAIEGTLTASGANLAADAPCTAAAGMSTLSAGGGGGGGGFAAAGGSGGQGGSAATALTGNALGGMAITGGFTPLLASCPGRSGKAAGNANEGTGGAAGGSIQITARDRIDIAGAIQANGAGGSGGTASTGGCGAGPCGAGGGGGGAGGVIFLEAPQVTFNGSLAKLCANGGGGGGGAGGGSTGGIATSGGQQCGDVQPSPGQPANGGGPGGGGGYYDRATGINGGDGDALPYTAGGGGGGSVGRIAVRGAVTGTRQVESPRIEMLP